MPTLQEIPDWLKKRLTPYWEAMQRLGRQIRPWLPAWGSALVWFRSSFLPSQNYLIILAITVGLFTGFGSVGFIEFLQLWTDFARTHVAPLFAGFGPAELLLLPAIGGLMAGPLITRFAPEAKGHGVPEVMTALASEGGKIRPQVVVIKVIASSLTIGFGGAAGREGPMVQIGAALGSAIGRWAKLTVSNIRTMVACGAAGGIAATFNAPIAGAIFSMEIIMGRIRADFLLVLLTSLSSCMITRHYLGNYPAFNAAHYDQAGPGELPLYFLMGILVGFGAVCYVKLLYQFEDWFGAWKAREYIKPALGGLIAGIALRFFPEIYGTGFPAIESGIWSRFGLEMMIGLFFAELIGNCATLGSGGSGGVFAPALFMGAMMGGTFGWFAHALFPAWTAGSGAYAMVGMAAFFAAAAKAPTTSILILFEMTGDYRVMLPLMAATVGSVYISHWLLPHSIYTLKLHKRGIEYPYDDEPAWPKAPSPEPEAVPAPSGGD